jgi:glycosyltransferase involved in cell wall biosynthesis
MRIAQISSVGTIVSSEGSDSVEHLVWLLSRGLTRLGHDVTVFGAAGSKVDAKLVETLPGPCGQNGAPIDWRMCEMINHCRAVEMSGEFDLMHSHGYLWGVPYEPFTKSPMLHTLHVFPYNDAVELLAIRPGSRISAISRDQWSRVPFVTPFGIVHHGVDSDHFHFRETPDDYVCWLGRFTQGKNPVAAIRAAQALGLRLILAGPPNPYFEEHVAPLVDGDRIQYVGKVGIAARDRLLGCARALLYPIDGPEPFGLVQVEAMHCGTPVVAMRLGGVSEIIDEGVTGYTAENYTQFFEMLPRAFELDRHRIRETAVRRFSVERMVREYVALYERVLAEAKK